MKNKKLFIRILTLLLALTMLLCCFASCKKDKATDDETTSGNTVSTNANGEAQDDGVIKDSLPDDLDYGGAEITIYGWRNGSLTEFDVNEMNGLPIDEAIFKKDLTVKERLNVTLKYDLFTDSDAYKYPTVVTNAAAGGDAYDIYGGHTRSIALCAKQGLFISLANIENSYLDFEKPWWNKSIIEKTSVGNNFYMCTGDITPSLPQMLYCIYFNENIINDLQLESPYDLVARNEWTLDTMLEMCLNYYDDTNQSKQVDIGDKLPLVGANWDWPALLHGCGVAMVEKDVTGDFVLANDLVGEKADGIMKDLADAIQLDGAYCRNSDAETKSSFMAQNSIFLITHSGVAAQYFADVTFQYGCVPCPKYDSEQENYVSAARQPVTMFGISKAVKIDRLSMITAVMECMASEGYRQVTPVVFDQVMRYQKATSAEMSEMLTLIRDTAWFDCGRIYMAELSGISDQPGMLLRDGKSWSTYVSGTVNTTIRNQLKELSSDLLEVAS